MAIIILDSLMIINTSSYHGRSDAAVVYGPGLATFCGGLLFDYIIADINIHFCSHSVKFLQRQGAMQSVDAVL
ncbi:MAG: hypothetical protein H7831_19065 [Magnetococcus sp. WYHC-3]